MPAAFEHAIVLFGERAYGNVDRGRGELGQVIGRHIAPPAAPLDPSSERKLKTARAAVRQRRAGGNVAMVAGLLCDLAYHIEPSDRAAAMRHLDKRLGEKNIPVARGGELRGEPFGILAQ